MGSSIVVSMIKIIVSIVTMFLASRYGHNIFLIAIKRMKIEEYFTRNDMTKWIGYLERALVALFVCLDLTAQTVFIFATKVAIMAYRISPKLSDDDKKLTAENMLIGTMISYLIALIFGLVGHWLILAFTGK